jgi:hypothetical protein
MVSLLLLLLFFFFFLFFTLSFLVSTFPQLLSPQVSTKQQNSKMKKLNILSFFSCVTAECIYKRKYLPPGHKPPSAIKQASRPTSSAGVDGDGNPGAAATANSAPPAQQQQQQQEQKATRALSAEDDAKLVFGTVFSLRNMVRKLGGLDDK